MNDDIFNCLSNMIMLKLPSPYSGRGAGGEGIYIKEQS